MSNAATIHDWTRVDAGIWHSFHLQWIAEINKELNGGVLPAPYYALAEPQGGFTVEEGAAGDRGTTGGPSTEPRRFEADLLALHESDEAADGGVLLADAAPRVRLTAPLTPSPPGARRIAVRYGSADRIVALIELVSPGNRDGRAKATAFCNKVEAAILAGVHVLMIDLFPSNPLLPTGMHGAVAERFGVEYRPPDGEPLTCASYRAAESATTSFVEPLRVGAAPPVMPLFLSRTRYVELPLADSYAAAFAATPRKYREALEPAT
ncbi:hypothetical protein [Alienimonas californiensis]|uniref:DUF4058 domain-containing protein n=1 Tax=Alienimonas californiensis TaxID=2527989 RepID=A0A517P973_9PLAN|nr:hypothetical protein [Alienimonas californiensis]QDT15918.1 hypothetical protein CA12_20160 [Alienimonas californiensis]